MSNEKEPLKISRKIVSVAIKKDTDEVEVPNLEYVHEDLKRPFKLKGTTYRIKPPQESSGLYLTVNNIILNEGTDNEQEYPYEVFVNAREMDSYQWIVAMTRSASAIFRKGGNVTFLVREYEAVKEPSGGYMGKDHFCNKPKGKFYDSVVAEIGYILRHHMEELGLMKPQFPPVEIVQAEPMDDKDIDESIDSDESNDIPPGYYKMDKKCPECGGQHFAMKDNCPTCLCGFSKCG